MFSSRDLRLCYYVRTLRTHLAPAILDIDVFVCNCCVRGIRLKYVIRSCSVSGRDLESFLMTVSLEFAGSSAID